MSFEYNGPELEVEYIKGNDDDFVVFIAKQKDKAEVKSIDGHARWILTKEDGSKCIVRPESAHE